MMIITKNVTWTSGPAQRACTTGMGYPGMGYRRNA
ncbi:hypothetical protein JOF34_000422 [Microbacterium amylolyticum]|uniref:Uncharacterized protein n=1 Tax=Microbacterium amylolyticum TaxID=936337 RepID=A0ABS4ZEX5_9MICO|nr:hypothetical protein [Microbacterium amylolyticum]